MVAADSQLLKKTKKFMENITKLFEKLLVI